MKNFEFKSQICTTKEQSERLLALGLKKETADMTIVMFGELCYELVGEVEINCGTIRMNGKEIDNNVKEHIPAWSLHRLIEMVADTPLQVGSQVGMYVEDTYDMVIQGIEWLISRGQFNKDYLEEKNY